MVHFSVRKLLVVSLLFGCFSLRAMVQEKEEDLTEDPSQWTIAEGEGEYYFVRDGGGQIISIESFLDDVFKKDENTTAGSGFKSHLTLIQITKSKKKKEGSCEWVKWAFLALGAAWIVHSYYFDHENLSGEGGGPSGLC